MISVKGTMQNMRTVRWKPAKIIAPSSCKFQNIKYHKNGRVNVKAVNSHSQLPHQNYVSESCHLRIGVKSRIP